MDGDVKGLMVTLFAVAAFLLGLVLGAGEISFMWLVAIPGGPLLAMLTYWWGKSNGGLSKSGAICTCGECID